MLKHKANFLVLALIALIFMYGVMHLLVLRFRQGDAYPPYSSFRSDPAGSKVLYEALADMENIKVSRNLDSLGKIESGKDTTLFYCGTNPEEMINFNAAEYRELSRLVASGCRLVLTMKPIYKKIELEKDHGCPPICPPPTPSDQTEEKEKNDKKSDNSDGEAEKKLRKLKKESSIYYADLLEKLDFEIESHEIPKEGILVVSPAQAEHITEYGLPGHLSWHSALVFKDIGPDWRVYYERGTSPVMMERSYGAGTIVLASDSYLHSNEAMTKERYSHLLSWLVGANHTVVFDETHLGIGKNPSIGQLGRKYGLHGFLVGLIFLAALIIWKNSARFVPPFEPDNMDNMTFAGAGKDYVTGFTNLLRRNIGNDQILQLCFEEWKKSGPAHGYVRKDKLERIEKIVRSGAGTEDRKKAIVQRYRLISRILAERR